MKILMIDTETAGTLEEPLVYDIGAQVMDLSGNVYESESWVVYDIYAVQREKMKTAYYAEKLPRYEEGLKNGNWIMKRFFTIRKTILEWIDRYEITAVCAYNTKFDRKALNNTLRFITEGRMRFFFPYGIEFFDVWTMASSTIFQTRTYRKMAYDNGWYSEKGNIRTTAEHAWRYISGNLDFDEAHTALEDVKIESEIFLRCWKNTTPEQRQIIGNPWRLPQKEWYYTEAKKDGAI